ncbi:unnamed protein product [Nesidiocoris tenuis]|uniref:Uncharacterized protein n=1 Tax=Nesidiocoris tenuis TaxID=355587 RepID=A0A6H5GKS0_9HEMI|nr:unnamed protein product [Nesidiocoris tenuis]
MRFESIDLRYDYLAGVENNNILKHTENNESNDRLRYDTIRSDWTHRVLATSMKHMTDRVSRPWPPPHPHAVIFGGLWPIGGCRPAWAISVSSQGATAEEVHYQTKFESYAVRVSHIMKKEIKTVKGKGKEIGKPEKLSYGARTGALIGSHHLHGFPCRVNYAGRESQHEPHTSARPQTEEKGDSSTDCGTFRSCGTVPFFPLSVLQTMGTRKRTAELNITTRGSTRITVSEEPLLADQLTFELGNRNKSNSAISTALTHNRRKAQADGTLVVSSMLSKATVDGPLHEKDTNSIAGKTRIKMKNESQRNGTELKQGQSDREIRRIRVPDKFRFINN